MEKILCGFIVDQASNLFLILLEFSFAAGMCVFGEMMSFAANVRC